MKALLITIGVILTTADALFLLLSIVALQRLSQTQNHFAVSYVVTILIVLLPGVLGILAIRAGVRRR
jgi:hypothetical protein